MNITVIGAGYVGLVCAACFADAGNRVVCLDLDAHKVARLQAGEMPIHEPGLDDLVRRNHAAARLRFSTSQDEAVAHAEVIFLAVGTPPEEDGSADLSHIISAARAIGLRMERPVIVVDKSTVPVGTAERVRDTIAQALQERGARIAFHVVSNPEFLKEGAAVRDFMRPDRIVIGSDDDDATAVMRQLYKPFNRNRDRIICMDTRSAELTKYAANAMLATRISFMNDMANLAEALDADIEAVRNGLGADPRIGPHFLYPGLGFGGSCFPKDVRALLKTAERHGQALEIVQAVDTVNEHQKRILFRKIARHFGGEDKLQGRTIALWGLSFKPNTNDMREAPSLVLIRDLIAAGCRVRAYDPAAQDEARHALLREHGEAVMAKFVRLVDTPWEAVQKAAALVLVTEWQEFRAPDFDALARMLTDRVVFDGRNLYEPEQVRAAGLRYYGIGRADAGRGT